MEFQTSQLLMMFSPLLTVIFLASAISANLIVSRTQSTSGGQAPIVTIRNGSYYGSHSSTYAQDFFLGIPFAQPPLEELRFANPQSLNWAWTGVLPATNYAHVSELNTDWAITKRDRNVLAMAAIKWGTSK
jgi:hypothetical protein